MTDSTDTSLQRSIVELKQSLDLLRSELVRKDVYDSDQRGVEQRMINLGGSFTSALTNIADDLGRLEKEVKDDRARAEANRRLIFTALAFPILVFLVQLYIQANLGGK